MAIDFGNTIMEEGIQPSVRVQAPVEDNSGEILARSLAPAAQVVGGVVGGIFKAQQQDATTKLLTSYESDLLDLADAVDQGMDRNQAMLRARNLRRQYLSNSPDLQADFDKIWTNFATSNGLGHVVVEGTIQSQAEDAINLEAAKLGYTRQQYDVVRARARELSAINDQFDLVSKSNGIITESMKSKGLQAVIGVADAAYPAAKSQIDTAMKAMDANPAQRGAIAQQTITSIKSQLAGIEGGALGAETEFITGPINDLLKTFEDWSNNTIESSVLENQIAFVQLQYDAMYTKDPVLGPFIAQSNLLKSVGLNDAVIAEKLLDDSVIKALRDATTANRSLNILADSVDTNKVVQSVTQAIGTDLDTNGIEEMKQFLAGVVDGAYQNERVNQDGALGYKGTIELLGSPEATEFVKQNGSLPAQYANEFISVIQSNYENEFLPVVQRYWESVPIQDPTGGQGMASMAAPPGVTNAGVAVANVPMNQLLDVVWNGSAVEFIPKQEWADNPRVQSLANEVNSGSDSIGIPLNNLINAHANVAGIEAKTVWEQQFANQIFNLEAQSLSEKVNRTLDTTNPDLPSISDFQVNDDVEFDQISAIRENEAAELPPIDPAYTNIEGVNYDSYLPSIRRSESGGNDSAKNPSSTATGRYQFLSSTWSDLVRRYPNSGLTPDGRLSPQQQEVAIRLFTAENARYLQRNNIPLSNGTLYAAHFLGAGDAVKVLNAERGLVSDYVPSKVINSNPFLRGMTVAQFRSWANRKGNA